jgi:hypothetical protein
VTAYAAGAHSQRTKSARHLSGFLFVQLARAFAEQHSILFTHTSSFFIWVVKRPKALQLIFSAIRAKNEKGRLEGDPTSLALTEGNVSVSLASSTD